MKESIAAFDRQRAKNESNPFFIAAVAPEEGKSGEITAQLLSDVRAQWDGMRAEFEKLLSGELSEFDLERVLKNERQIVANIERLRFVMGRFYDRKYGA